MMGRKPLLLLFASSFCMVAALAQDAPPTRQRISLPQDWSHRHVLFTNGGTAANIAAVQSDPRLLHNWLLRNVRAPMPSIRQQPGPSFNLRDENPRFNRGRQRQRPPNINSRIDWALPLGPNGGVPMGESPAKFSFDVNAAPSCANDFVVFTIDATPGVGSQANIVAVNNLYSGTGPTGLCGTAPTFMWSYAIGAGRAYLSPVLSLDGKKVGFLESASSSHARFHVLTWVAGQGTNATTGAVAPGTGGSVDVNLDYTNISKVGCTAVPAAVTYASPFVDYNHDAAFLAADNGRLYRIKDVFLGTPTVDFCVTVNAGAALTSPVYDFASNKVFISDGSRVYAYTVGATSFTAAGSIAVASGGIVLSPIVDVTNGFVYVFSRDNIGNTAAIISQMPESLASHVDVAIGPIHPLANGFILDGAFDIKYFNSPSTGSLYACGTDPANSANPALYTISFGAGGVMNTTAVMSANRNINPGGRNGECSPLLEFFDGVNDRLFIGAGNPGSTNGANAVTMWNINSRITSTTATPAAVASPYYGGTSGFAVDNLSTQPQAASIYFGTLARSATTACGASQYCAVKLTQSALQ